MPVTRSRGGNEKSEHEEGKEDEAVAVQTSGSQSAGGGKKTKSPKKTPMVAVSSASTPKSSPQKEKSVDTGKKKSGSTKSSEVATMPPPSASVSSTPTRLSRKQQQQLASSPQQQQQQEGQNPIPQSPSRRSARLRGAQAEYTLEQLDKLAKHNREEARSRSRSTTPQRRSAIATTAAGTTAKGKGKVEKQQGDEAVPTGGYSSSPQRPRINFNENEGVGDADVVTTPAPTPEGAKRQQHPRPEEEGVEAEVDADLAKPASPEQRKSPRRRSSNMATEAEAPTEQVCKAKGSARVSPSKPKHTYFNEEEEEEEEEDARLILEESTSSGKHSPKEKNSKRRSSSTCVAAEAEGPTEETGGNKAKGSPSLPKHIYFDEEGEETAEKVVKGAEGEVSGEQTTTGVEGGGVENGEETAGRTTGEGVAVLTERGEAPAGEPTSEKVARKKRKRKRMSNSSEEGARERGEEEEEQVENEATVLNKRKRFKQSEVDDEFFNLDEMHQFCEAEERKEASSSKGKKKGERTLGDYEAAEEMGEMIQRFEEENLEPRSWELAGEATGEQRERDELLDDYVEVDFRAQPPPSINADHTARLEAIIKQRIKDRAFDDPVRKYRQDESTSLVPTRRGRAQAEAAAEQGVRKSLAEVYEERFQRDQQRYEEEGEKSGVVGAGGERSREVVEEEVHIDPATEAIDKDMRRLFAKLDALAHFQFKPPEIKPELKIVSNMASLRVEEVGPIASTSADSQLLAPSEVFTVKKGAVKAKEERSATDKKRERRKKKKKQRAMAAMGLLPAKEPTEAKSGGKRKVRFTPSAEGGHHDEAMNGAGKKMGEKKKRRVEKKKGELGGDGSIEA